MRAALRHLEAWARGGIAPPQAARLAVAENAFVLDENGNARGGVRTPVVAAPVEVLRGDTERDASVICQLFGSIVSQACEAVLRAHLHECGEISYVVIGDEYWIVTMRRVQSR